MNVSKWFKGDTSPLAKSSSGRKMSALRVFAIVATLHAVVLGPILIFEGCKNASNTDKVAEGTEPAAPDTATPMPPAVTNAGQIASAPQAPLTAPAFAPSPATAAPAAPAPQDTVVKTVKVQKGDTLWKIAKEEKVNVSDLMRVNNLTEKSVLQIGQEIKIPAASGSNATSSSTANPTSASGETVHVVQAGESLWAIAKQYNTTVAALREANHLSSNTLKVNQKLIIPVKAQATPPAAPVAPEAPKAAAPHAG